MLHRFTLLALMLIAAVGVAGCGGDDSSSKSSSTSKDSGGAMTDSTAKSGGDSMEATGDKGTVLELSAVDNKLEFDTKELTAPAGTVTINLTNPSTIPHNIGVKQGDKEQGATGELVTSGKVSTITVDLEPGEYTFFCAPHESSGMVGKLTIT